ncbi:MAG: toll/interleukin-1 receptor domain-containing protein [Alphaproteobacteria bacterium]|nr:toll/interleukin-1 receptor domain-containing protein [Alphaproteobacteria bacterium]
MASSDLRVFINYRRDDSPGSAGRLHDRLALEIPPEHLFMDVDAIAPGVDFVDEIDRKVRACDVMLAIIGRGWLDAADKEGRRRLDDAADFVRLEIAMALRHGVNVVPILVDGARMPAAEDLPEELRALARRNAVELSHQRFAAEAKSLAQALVKSHAEAKARAAAAEAAARPRLLSSRRLAGAAATAFAFIASGAIPGHFFAAPGTEWWFLRIGPGAQLWVAFGAMVGPALALKLWIPRLALRQFWKCVAAIFGTLVAMAALALGLQEAFMSFVPPNPQRGVDMLVWMGTIEIPVTFASGAVLGWLLAWALRFWFPDKGGPGFFSRMVLIWIAAGLSYAVANYLLISIAEAAAARVAGAEDALGAREAMRMWTDTVVFGLCWALGIVLTFRLAARAR